MAPSTQAATPEDVRTVPGYGNVTVWQFRPSSCVPGYMRPRNCPNIGALSSVGIDELTPSAANEPKPLVSKHAIRIKHLQIRSFVARVCVDGKVLRWLCLLGVVPRVREAHVRRRFWLRFAAEKESRARKVALNFLRLPKLSVAQRRGKKVADILPKRDDAPKAEEPTPAPSAPAPCFR